MTVSLLTDLEKNEYISRTNVRLSENYCQCWKVSPYAALLETHALTEHDLADAIAETYAIERVYSFDKNDVDLSVLSKVSYPEALQFHCVVPHRDEKGTYLVYIVDPTDKALISFLDQTLILYKLVVVDITLMIRSIDEAYPLEFQIPSLLRLKDEP